MPKQLQARQATRLYRQLINTAIKVCLGAILLGLLPSCDMLSGDSSDDSYRIVEGACGDLKFVENLGEDLASALKIFEAKKSEELNRSCLQGECYNIRVEPYELVVENKKGNAPAEKFYALRVLDSNSGVPVHSVNSAVSTGGDLFLLKWCRD